NTKAYLLGLIAADGCVTSKNYIAFESTEIELTELLKSEIDYTGEIRVIYPKGDYAEHYRINFSSGKMAMALVKCGVFAGRTFSDVCYFPDAKYLPAYVLGYFDGDGCAYANQGRSGGLVCIVGSLAFVNELSNHLNMGSVIKHHCSNVYYWRIFSRQNIEKFYQLVYQFKSLGLIRKKQKIEQILRSYRRG
ncbi:MAG TPA: LAGLIDADG family homing endonuclease, partial [Leptolyngbya sp.]|nr:LAGLIDADG family homing endonuclease [Leptolyngbya sp.]